MFMFMYADIRRGTSTTAQYTRVIIVISNSG